MLRVVKIEEMDIDQLFNHIKANTEVWMHWAEKLHDPTAPKHRADLSETLAEAHTRYVKLVREQIAPANYYADFLDGLGKNGTV